MAEGCVHTFRTNAALLWRRLRWNCCSHPDSPCRRDRPHFLPQKGREEEPQERLKDRKSTRLNSSHGYISYAVFCLKKKTNNNKHQKRQIRKILAHGRLCCAPMNWTS